MSDHYPLEEVLHLLDEYFDVVVSAIQEHGGEVLKFIGDEVLAIFRTGDETEACERGLQAARAAQRSAVELNRRRQSYGRPPIDFGTALHYGTVMYGNIGSADRLDFTVIGPAVNTCSRLCSLCSTLARAILVSGELAARHPEGLEPLGRHDIRGIARGIDIFGIAGG